MGNWLIFFVLSQFFVEIFLMEGEAETQKSLPLKETPPTSSEIFSQTETKTQISRPEVQQKKYYRNSVS